MELGLRQKYTKMQEKKIRERKRKKRQEIRLLNARIHFLNFSVISDNG